MVQRRDGGLHESMVSAGMSLIIPEGCDSTWDGDAAASARLRIPTALIAEASEQLGRRSVAQVEVRNVFETHDPLIERIALILMDELGREPHPAQALIADHASALLAAHLLRSYNGFDFIQRQGLPSLGKADLMRVTAYVEDNLSRTIGLAELAALVNVGRFHFTRLFKRATGMTASSFVEERRIRRAQSLILETDLPLSEIALMVGFADQSHFTRRFHRHVGCTPGAFAREHGRRRSTRRTRAL